MSAPQSHDPLVVTTKDGVSWLRRAVTQDGHGLYAVTDSCTCPEYLMASLAELAEHGIAGSAHALPMPVAPEPAAYPPAFPWAALMDGEDLSDFLDELAASAITHASSEVALAEVEATCGRWRLIAEAQHAHNTAPGPGVEAPYVSRLLPPRDAVCARPGCGHSGAEHHHGDTKCWAHLPKGHGDPIRLCVCEGFVAGSSVEVSADRLTRLLAPSQVLREDAYESPLHHDYRVSHDLPEPAHPVPCRFPKSPGCTCRLTGSDVEPAGGGS
jgi:hypothetical protein